MRIIILSALIVLFLNSLTYSHTQTPVYLTFVTHNEDAEPYNTNFNYYILRRNIIVQLADSLIARGAKWNFQSDWRFLLGVKNFDTGNVILNTNGKNLIKWLVEDKGIDCDPHAHENAYNYADIAYLHSQIGITPSGVVGGFLYDSIVNGNNWENLENGIYGRVYTAYFWKPDILFGGGTQNHLNDPQNLGAWKPQSMANYYFHDTTKHLTLIGNGCANKIYDTTNVSTAIQRIRNIVNAITYHALPDTGFYTATVFMSIGQFNTSQMNKMLQFIDSIKVFADQEKVVWKNLKDIYNTWNSSYGKKPFWEQCADIPVIFTPLEIKLSEEGFYEPAENRLRLSDTVTAYLRNINSPFNIVDSAKTKIDSLSFKGNFVFYRAGAGNYYIVVKHRNCIQTWSKAGGIIFNPGTPSAYDFTLSQSQAYGSNLKLTGTKYSLYSGDADQNGYINLNDILIIYNDALTFTTGYTASDINGDNLVNLSDYLIALNNSVAFVRMIAP
ncbi:MAG: hypothetical protein ABI462_10640 [Ignavibacteria bacterium]